ncbi:uncharacterized protein [Montipora foliosa]|uniref:uncharacterized protein n=1 Tax=Montipora foliosa TaxID=591990 RepID=UPI0035F183BB
MGTPPIVQFIITSAFVSLHVTSACPNDDCRELAFPSFFFFAHKLLVKHNITTIQVHDLEECKRRCYQYPNCVSVNIHTHKNDEGLYRCELNNATHLRHGPEFLDAVDYFYHGADSACDKVGRCDNGGVCQSGYTDKGYRCVCPPGWKFAHCQQAVPAVPVSSSSCKELYEKHKCSKSQVYPLMFGSQKIPVYCHMENFGCGGGGWTLAMKTYGKKKTFHYDSALWSNKNAYNLPGGKTGFDFEETKLPTYWNTSFSKICLGMKIPGQPIKFLVINKQAQSLHSLIADGKYHSISLSRNTWKTLIGSQESLQANCNREGFNAASQRGDHSKARIGIIGNNENDCVTGDSIIGFGCGRHPHASNTCGNMYGSKNIKAMGYILVQ